MEEGELSRELRYGTWFVYRVKKDGNLNMLGTSRAAHKAPIMGVKLPRYSLPLGLPCCNGN
jgi:hypothetical protein